MPWNLLATWGLAGDILWCRQDEVETASTGRFQSGLSAPDWFVQLVVYLYYLAGTLQAFMEPV
ncbi:hypothetical protein OE88DRAFT_1656161 [Heliocybe sulcata]|uniref:Uncharacterized protein n=1 Tax=Heliocybe sulcata TaxID=5364 RepID=A0A5C3NCW0_9AGAM|nr:hypothetical protein OE88DRAFT_1656161 [Heliocybe sulcata]